MIGEKKGYQGKNKINYYTDHLFNRKQHDLLIYNLLGVRIIFKQFPNVNFKAILNKSGFSPSPYYFYLTKYEGK